MGDVNPVDNSAHRVFHKRLWMVFYRNSRRFGGVLEITGTGIPANGAVYPLLSLVRAEWLL